MPTPTRMRSLARDKERAAHFSARKSPFSDWFVLRATAFGRYGAAHAPKTHDESMGPLHRTHSASPTSPPAVVTDARRTPHRAGSCPRVPHGPAVPLALTIRTRALDGDADQRTPIGRHRPTIVIPIRMFPGQTTIIIYERFHG